MKSLKKSVFLFMILAGVGLAAREMAAFAFPPTPHGKRAAAYFAAFNSAGESAMAVFLKKNFSAEALQRVSLDERLARFRGFRQQARTLNVEKMLRDTGDAVSFLARDGQGEMLEFTFQFEKSKSAKILSIMGAPINPEDLAELSGPPLSREEVLARVRAELDERSRADRFSGVVLLAQGDQVLLHEARGQASVDYGAANRPDTRFNLGSINKLFTRVAMGNWLRKANSRWTTRLKNSFPTIPTARRQKKYLSASYWT